MKLDICLCTHNPRRDVFQKVLEAVGAQTLSRDQFHFWIIDNASSPALGDADLAPLKTAKVNHTLLQEPRLGNVHSRAKAIQATQNEWVVFVDDDNVLSPDYLQQVVNIASRSSKLGCFGGKLLLPKVITVPSWAQPLLPYLAIKDAGPEVITNCVNEWGLWEPPTAGAAVRRPVLELYRYRLEHQPELSRLGRKGKRGLFSCEDSLMMRGAYSLGLASSYQPSLVLEHHLAQDRFRFGYFARLMYGLGRSHVILERSLGREVSPGTRKYGWRLLRKVPLNKLKFCRRAYEWGWFLESRTLLHNGQANGHQN